MEFKKIIPTDAEFSAILKDLENDGLFAGLKLHQVRDKVHIIGDRLRQIHLEEFARVLLCETPARNDEDVLQVQRTFLAWGRIKGEFELCIQFATEGHRPALVPLMTAKEPYRSLGLWHLGALLQELHKALRLRAAMTRDLDAFMGVLLDSFDTAKQQFAATHTKPQELIEVESDAQPAKPQTVTTLSTGGKC